MLFIKAILSNNIMETLTATVINGNYPNSVAVFFSSGEKLIIHNAILEQCTADAVCNKDILVLYEIFNTIKNGVKFKDFYYENN